MNLFKEFLKKYWWVVAIVVILSGVIIYQQVKLHKKNSIIYYQDSIIALNSEQYKTLAEQYQNEKNAIADLERYNKQLADELDKANETIRNYTQIIIKLKNQTYTYKDTITVFNVINDTIRVPLGKDSVFINIGNSLYDIKGVTYLYPKKGYDVLFTGKPITLDIVVSEDANGIYNSYIDVNNPDLELIKFQTRFLKEEPTFWEQVSGQVSLGLTNKNVLFDLGIAYKKWGVKGIIGLDYQSYTIQKDNFIFGGGITYQIF